MKLVDMTASPVINRSVNLMEIAQRANGRVDGVGILATGTITSGEVKLEGSQNGTDFFPLEDGTGSQITIKVGKFTFLKFQNLIIRCDVSNVVSSDLNVEVQ